MTKKYILTEARESQLPELLKVCVKAFKETPEGVLNIDKDKMESILTHIVSSPHQLSVVAMCNGRVKGLLLGFADSHVYCKGMTAEDICFYVSPTLRGTNLAENFIDIYDDWCSQIPNLTVQSLSLNGLSASSQFMQSLFKHRGYKLLGKTYGKICVE
jgi:hypothetical protein